LRTIIGQSDAANIGHWEINGEDGSLYWSDEVYRIHGLQPGGKIDVEAAIAAYHPDDRALVAEFVRKAVEDHQDYQFNLRIIRPNGEIRDTQSTGVVRLNADKSLHTVFAVCSSRQPAYSPNFAQSSGECPEVYSGVGQNNRCNPSQRHRRCNHIRIPVLVFRQSF
jgi:PAS domain-containing protein